MGEIFFGQNVSWPCGISMQKIFFEKSHFFKKFEKSGGEKMVITGHPWWLIKIFFGQNVSWACGISMQKIFFEKKQLLGSYGTFTLFSV